MHDGGPREELGSVVGARGHPRFDVTTLASTWNQDTDEFNVKVVMLEVRGRSQGDFSVISREGRKYAASRSLPRTMVYCVAWRRSIVFS